MVKISILLESDYLTMSMTQTCPLGRQEWFKSECWKCCRRELSNEDPTEELVVQTFQMKKQGCWRSVKELIINICSPEIFEANKSHLKDSCSTPIALSDKGEDLKPFFPQILGGPKIMSLYITCTKTATLRDVSQLLKPHTTDFILNHCKIVKRDNFCSVINTIVLKLTWWDAPVHQKQRNPASLW